MPRRKITSTRQKRADQQLKRAVKRGDVPKPDPSAQLKAKKRKLKRPSGPQEKVHPSQETARKLESSFFRLSSSFLAVSRDLSSRIPPPRPLAVTSAIFSNTPDDSETDALLKLFICPRRPKWRFDMSKLEVERNEEGLFQKWLATSDEIVNQWQSLHDKKDSSGGADDPEPEPTEEKMPLSSTYFERNVEVWRQLWRVTEISQIILVLLDSRCPLLHLPDSLVNYLSGRKVILLLTKVDISGQERVEAWINYFRQRYPDYPIVPVESYLERERTFNQQGRPIYHPHIPQTFRDRLISAIKLAHSELIAPPKKVKTDPERLKNWKCSVPQFIDWDALAHSDDTSLYSASRDNAEDAFLTVGVIGQPNVGKSSLLNALFGASRVRASKTPGKTKHFQTLFWSKDVRLVDCPGLVFPNLVSMEMQVLSGILPISRVSAVPACIYFACQYLPLEQIYELTHPSEFDPTLEDKRTWRDAIKREKSKQTIWTAMDILVSFANKKGWLTAKAARPDIHRAGNAILRALAEGRVPWAFWPPGTDPSVASDAAGFGIWLRTHAVESDNGESDYEGSSSISQGDESTDSETASEEQESSSDASPRRSDLIASGGSRFAALNLNEGDGDDDSGSAEEREPHRMT